MGCLLVPVAFLLGPFVGGWMFMLAVGVAHHEWLPMMPTIGYWPSVLIIFLLSVVCFFLPIGVGSID